jgi:DNA-binding CsgD family transcriptional regulator
MTIRGRIFLHLLALVTVMLTGIVAVLVASGGLSPAADARALLRKENNHMAQNAGARLGDVSRQCVLLSEALSGVAAGKMEIAGSDGAPLRESPEILESLLGEMVDSLMLFLGKTKCSGVFAALDATVNPRLEKAPRSKAGLYIRDTDQGFLDRNEDKLFLRGSPKIALSNGFTLQSEWELEFDVSGQAFWEVPLSLRAENPKLPLSRLYSWSFSGVPGFGGRAAVCSAPVLGAGGETLGVCGFEISARNFKLLADLDAGDYPRMIGIFGVSSENEISLSEALFSGNAAVYGPLSAGGALTAKGMLRGLELFVSEGAGEFVGIKQGIRVYPGDSPLAGQVYAVTIAIPREDYDAASKASYLRLFLISAIVLCVGVGFSVLLSERCANPVTEVVTALGKGDTDVKTNIMEIDVIVERIKALHPSDENLFADFIGRVGSLTPTEKQIFDCYVAGYGVEGILSAMSITLNTLKRHNNHIYAKLRVSGRDEMLLYAELIRKAGKLSEIS